jgi:hypothetical protein
MRIVVGCDLEELGIFERIDTGGGAKSAGSEFCRHNQQETRKEARLFSPSLSRRGPHAQGEPSVGKSSFVGDGAHHGTYPHCLGGNEEKLILRLLSSDMRVYERFLRVGGCDQWFGGGDLNPNLPVHVNRIQSAGLQSDA